MPFLLNFLIQLNLAAILISRFFRTHGLYLSYRDDAVVRTLMRMVMALGLVEPLNVRPVFHLIRQNRFTLRPTSLIILKTNG